MTNKSAPKVSCNSHDKDTKKTYNNGDFLPKIENDSIINQINLEFNKLKFDEIIYQDLPPILKNTCNILTESTEKEVFFFGAIGVISGILPNVNGYYDGKFYSPNIYNFLVGNYGEGKGVLLKAKLLAGKIHTKKVKEYESQLAEYVNNEEKGIKPTRKLIYIPANNSKSGIVHLLKENNERGILFLSEADTLTDILKQDFGNFSDILRGMFHHEGYEQYRITNDEYSYIEKGYISVLISGTFDQLYKLIPNAENGLFSRFLYYRFNPQKGIFKHVFHSKKKNYAKLFENSAIKFQEIYEKLIKLEEPIKFSLTKNQEEIFYKIFQNWKTEFFDIYGGDLDGLINRLGLISFRLMMLFSVLRIIDDKIQHLPKKIICEDIDFLNALRVIQISKNNALEVYNMLPKKKNRSKRLIELDEKTIIAKFLYKYNDKQFSLRKLSEILGISHTKIGKLIKS